MQRVHASAVSCCEENMRNAQTLVVLVVSGFATAARSEPSATSASGDSMPSPAFEAAPYASSGQTNAPPPSTLDYVYTAVTYSAPVVNCIDCGIFLGAVGLTATQPELMPYTIAPLMHQGDPSSQLQACASCGISIYNALPSWSPQPASIPLYGPVTPYTPPLAPFPAVEMTNGYDYPVGRTSSGTSLPSSFYGP
jgi:hypothetical protein